MSQALKFHTCGSIIQGLWGERQVRDGRVLVISQGPEPGGFRKRELQRLGHREPPSRGRQGQALKTPGRRARIRPAQPASRTRAASAAPSGRGLRGLLAVAALAGELGGTDPYSQQLEKQETKQPRS